MTVQKAAKAVRRTAGRGSRRSGGRPGDGQDRPPNNRQLFLTDYSIVLLDDRGVAVNVVPLPG